MIIDMEMVIGLIVLCVVTLSVAGRVPRPVGYLIAFVVAHVWFIYFMPEAMILIYCIDLDQDWIPGCAAWS